MPEKTGTCVLLSAMLSWTEAQRNAVSGLPEAADPIKEQLNDLLDKQESLINDAEVCF
tara:strand:+ start:2927 stop:3100 length:174 start_codon:yes stop_codon:yes gene_type:complete